MLKHISLPHLVAASFLIFVFLMTVLSIRNDSLTMDELAHLPAGFSYLTQKDMRLNPEHPPLIKDLAAIPLLFIPDIKFPYQVRDWQEDINGQWGFGWQFLYNSGNPADEMIFWGRIPMILILILLGFYIFKVAREFYGKKAGLLAIVLFSFSPTLLAHGRLVTTDVGAALGTLMATYYFVRALQNPTRKNVIFSGLALGLAQLLKFSVILLVPFFAILTFAWWFVKASSLKGAVKILGLVLVTGFAVIWPVYQYHVWGYPPERQTHDIQVMMASTPYPKIREVLVWAANKPVLRAYAQYLLGLSLVFQRAAGGNTTYFWGQVSAAGWKIYFPTVYLIKETLTFHILTLIGLLYASFAIAQPFWKHPLPRIISWVRHNFAAFAMMLFVAVYWTTSLYSNLNIGVRHLLPTLPLMIILVSYATACWLKNPFLRLRYFLLGLFLAWQAVSVIGIYPHFLAYFNELAGGSNSGYIYTVDSNLDWGQDLKRLTDWVNENHIEKIYVDYFGGGDAKYYLKDKFNSWWGTRDPKELPAESYLAVSATFLQGGRGEPSQGFNQSFGYYRWLDQYQPVAKIGYSIFVYHIK